MEITKYVEKGHMEVGYMDEGHTSNILIGIRLKKDTRNMQKRNI